jgi:peptidoglycan/xylan/chitin deacetylase (PgdA/CDA1 family)
MLHRFRDPERGVEGCDAADLRRALTFLSENDYEFVTLVEMFDRLAGKGPDPRGAVAFTIDDGYLDQATVAAPVFAEFGCPVTTFVSTGFLDGALWFWWDQIVYVFQRTARKSIRLRLGDELLAYSWVDDSGRIEAQNAFTEKCKRVPNDVKLAAIAQLARTAEVDIPEAAPAHCAPMTWAQLRDCERRGMSFGPHTVTHPILSQTTDDQARAEIMGSWSRLCEEARNPIPVFCYPNGGWHDFGEREMDVLRSLRFTGAVAGELGYANAQSFQRTPDDRFKVRRFAFPDELPRVVQYVSGVERMKQILRGR